MSAAAKVKAEIVEPMPNETVATYKPLSRLAVDAAAAETPPIRSYSTGNLQLDNLLGGGINTRELAIVLGPPGGHKTAWAVALALELERRVPVLYASTELETHELMARVAANVLGRSWAGIRRGALPRETVIESLRGLRIHLLGCEVLPRDGARAMATIEAEARHLAEQYGTSPAIEIDYLQDLARGAERDLKSRVGDLASDARAMSQQLDCPVIAISSVARTFYSLRRAAEFREADDPTVYLAAAKESGDVDYAAARVIFLDAEDGREKPERAVRIAVAKSRDARTGFAGARVLAECGRFMPAPEVLDAMAVAGRGVEDTIDSGNEDDAAMLKRVVTEHAAGNRAQCTKRYLRTGNKLGRKPMGKDRAESALERLVAAGRLRVVTVQRVEGGKPKARDVYEPAGDIS